MSDSCSIKIECQKQTKDSINESDSSNDDELSLKNKWNYQNINSTHFQSFGSKGS